MRMVFVPPHCPLFCASVPRQPKSKAFGLEFVNRTVLDKNEYDLWYNQFKRLNKGDYPGRK